MATKDEIWAAAQALADAGERPTLAAVRRMIGGGSFTTISEAMAEWRALQEQPKVEIDPAPERIGVQAAELANSLWAQASALAHEKLQAERAALEASRQELERERAEAAELADGLSVEIEQMRGENQALEAKIVALTATIEEQRQEIERRRQEAVEARENAAELRGQVEALQRIIAEWKPREPAEKGA
ncbi:MAG: DNA-binding protein [Acidithiobacillus sp.]|nr:DNA-binding protein [Acidithiobacillus sp.]